MVKRIHTDEAMPVPYTNHPDNENIEQWKLWAEREDGPRAYLCGSGRI